MYGLTGGNVNKPSPYPSPSFRRYIRVAFAEGRPPTGLLVEGYGGESWLRVVTPAGVEGWASTAFLER